MVSRKDSFRLLKTYQVQFRTEGQVDVIYELPEGFESKSFRRTIIF